MTPVRFSSCVVKLASRCNLACDYCYVYEMQDTGWRRQPARMSLATVDAFSNAVGDYLRDTSIKSFDIVLHGGEPLLAGKQTISYLLDSIARIRANTGSTITTVIQTNATLIDREWLSLLKHHRVLIGVSHDGPPHLSDKHRRTHNGGGSAKAVEEAIRLLTAEVPDLFQGCLMVIDPRWQAQEVVSYFHQLGIRKLDLLLPDQNYVAVAPAHPPAREASMAYRDFLLSAYRVWRTIDDPSFDIRLFRQLILAVLGRPSTLDTIGTLDIGIFTVDVDGSLQALDSYRCCGDGFTDFGLNVATNSIGSLAAQPGLLPLCERSRSVGEECTSCQYFQLCGGGYPPHRYNGVDFASRSVYCDALMALCEAIVTDVATEVAEAHRALPATSQRSV